MPNNKKNRGLQHGCQHGCQQNPNADNQFEGQMKRLCEVVNAKNDAHLARILRIQPQSIHSARKRKKIPYKWITRISEIYKVSSDWLLFGEGSMKRGGSLPSGEASSIVHNNKGAYKTAPLNESILQKAIEMVEEILAKQEVSYLNPVQKSLMILQLYSVLLKNPDIEEAKSTFIKLIKLIA